MGRASSPVHVASPTSSPPDNAGQPSLCALVFLVNRVLSLEMPALDGLERARRPVHLPAVLSRREVQALLQALAPPFQLIAEMLYGSGLRLLECLALRVKDVDL